MSAGWTLLPALEPSFAQDISNTLATAISATVRTNLVKLQHRHERFLRDLDGPDSLHPSLSFLLFLEQLALAGDVASVTLCQDVLSHRRHGFAGDDLTADGGLDRHLVQLARDDRLQLLDQLAALDLCLAAVGDQRKRIDRLARDQHVELDEVAFAEADHLVIHRRVSLRTGLELVIEVVDDLSQRNLILEHDTVAWTVLQLLERTAAILAQLHHRPDVTGRRDDRKFHVRLGDRLDRCRVWQQSGVVDLDGLAALQLDSVLDGRRGCDEVELELALEPLLDDLEMEQAQEPASKTKPKSS